MLITDKSLGAFKVPKVPVVLSIASGFGLLSSINVVGAVVVDPPVTTCLETHWAKSVECVDKR